MSLLSGFLAAHLIPALEGELIPALEQALLAHEPEVQAAIIAEMEAFATQIGTWLEDKIDPVGLPPK